ncbi:hypothetical protein NP233_g1155 [Leucocoprinus birnbaumii]|uniref:Large ribosomal subunit protein uL29m n=1 Tax=Leucocoprinus birnbaumii TaxID=56174 RepID=A0AAD5W112_9AGAR|nr:hypothetical protein NP233_g1155 [Leucocoprinus birnbaumii]
MSALSLARNTLRQRTPQLQPSVQCTRRWLAEIVDIAPNPPADEIAITAAPTTEPVNWRREKVPVREDHGLYAFFRMKEPQEGEKLEGEDKYAVCESPQTYHSISGRGWKAEELRLKSFNDLHTLWYVLLRERNLLATQKEETRRMGVQNPEFQVNGRKLFHVRKSMARIKQVLNERRLAYESAYDIAAAQQETYNNETVLTHLRDERRRRAEEAEIAAKVAREEAERLAAEALARKEQEKLERMRALAVARAKAKADADAAAAEAAEIAATTAAEKVKTRGPKEPKPAPPPKTPREQASQTAAAGLFGRFSGFGRR